MNKYIDKIEERYLDKEAFAPARDDKSLAGEAAKTAVGAGAVVGGAIAGKKLGRKAATTSPVQSRIKERATAVASRASDAAQAKKDRIVGAQRKKIRKLKSTVKKDTRPGQARAAEMKQKLRGKQVKAVQDKAKVARSAAGKTVTENKFIRKATKKAKGKFGRVGMIAGGVAGLAGASSALADDK